MPRPRTLAAIALACVAGWLVLLVVLDVALAGRQAGRVRDRVGEALHGDATIGDADLQLVRGGLVLDGLSVHRDDPAGRLALTVPEIDCDLPPLGAALVDGRCRELRITGMRLDVSSAALLQLAHPARAPIRSDRVVIDDAELDFAPSAFAPSLGRIAIAIDHAEAGATAFRTPLSWLFALVELRARIELPAGISVRLAYVGGRIAAAGTLFGADPVAVPLQLPAPGAARDGRAELDLLVQTGEDVAARLVEQRAIDWLRAKLR